MAFLRTSSDVFIGLDEMIKAVEGAPEEATWDMSCVHN